MRLRPTALRAIGACIVCSLASILACAGCASHEERAVGERTEADEGGTRAAIEFPLRMWMNGNATNASKSESLPALRRAFVRIADFAPDGYDAWQAFAVQGARAAESGDLEGCREACKNCHDAYRAAYRRDHARRVLPP